MRPAAGFLPHPHPDLLALSPLSPAATVSPTPRRRAGSARRAIALQFGHAEQIGQQLQGAWRQRRAPRLWPHLVAYLALVALIFGAFATANDRPTDFPLGVGPQLVLALALPAGMLAVQVGRYLRARRSIRAA
jgi:hypothetical protein